VAWLSGSNIQYNLIQTGAELLGLQKLRKQKIMHFELCCEMAAIPHCQCNLVEFVWAQVKHEVADSYPALGFGMFTF
jgi:hypothetical protein